MIKKVKGHVQLTGSSTFARMDVWPKMYSANSNLKPDPKAQKRFLENEMTSFFGQVTRYPIDQWRRPPVLILCRNTIV